MILVTGAGGFLGSFVCAHLQNENREYLGTDRHSPKDYDSKCVACDVTDPDAVAALFRTHRIDTVIHLAAMLPSASQANPYEGTRVNVSGGVTLLEAAARFGTARFVFGSSMSVYGRVANGQPIPESHPATPVDTYGAAKRYLEIYAETLAANGGPPFVSLRLANLVGPGARRTGSPWRSEMFEKLDSATPQQISIPFAEDAVLSLVHVEDAARMLILLASTDPAPSQVYNTPSENWTAGDLKRLVESLNPNLTVNLDHRGGRPQQPVADGSRFVKDYAWSAAPLRERLAALRARSH